MLRRSLLVAALLVVPSSAFGQAQKDHDARTQFRKAVALYDKKDCKEALPIFVKVHEALKSPNALLYAARCLRDLHRMPEAYEAFGAVVREASDQAQRDASYEETRDAAAAERSVIEPVVARVLLLAPDPPADLSIELNGTVVPADRIGSVMAVTPGKISVTAKAAGHRDFHQDLQVREGASAPINIKLESDAAPTPALENNGSNGGNAATVATPVPDEPPPSRTSGRVRTLGFAVAGVGVAGLATFVVTRLMGDAKLRDLDAACGPCSQAYFNQQSSSGKTLDLITNIGLGVGIVGAVAGTGMIVFGGPHDVTPPAPGAHVFLAPGAVGVHGAF